ncbi:MAG: helix-turn-helix domain-containing protein [Verrucomicrobiaceae bacterium]|nr:helix-turn-helix domain-containing protein [Verrucomicrobiaceae bacterium]
MHRTELGERDSRRGARGHGLHADNERLPPLAGVALVAGTRTPKLPAERASRSFEKCGIRDEGRSREEVAALSHFSPRQVLRFIQAFNLAGLDGLIPGRSSGRRRIVPKEQLAEKIAPVIEDPSMAGQSH